MITDEQFPSLKELIQAIIDIIQNIQKIFNRFQDNPGRERIKNPMPPAGDSC